jgi:hypothetical protein
MIATVPAPLWAVKFQLEAYPKMPLAGWVYLGVGVLLLILTFAIRGMKLSGLLASLTFLLYYPASYALYWYSDNYVTGTAGLPALPDPTKFDPANLPSFDPGALKDVVDAMLPGSGTLRKSLKDPATQKLLLITFGVLGGLFCLCMLESAINYRRDPQKRRDYEEYMEDNPFAPPPVAPPPLPGTRAPQPRPSPGTQARRSAPKRPGPPQGGKNPFDFH